MSRFPLLLVLSVFLVPLGQAQGGGVPGAGPGTIQRMFEVVHYDFRARSEQDVLQAMLQGGPVWEGERYFGLTQSELRYSYVKHESVTGCFLSGVSVQIRVTMTLPRWQPESGVPYALERDWRQFERALRLHEEGHQRLAEEEAEMIRRALTALRAPTCATIDATARQQAGQIQASYAALNRNYDARTEHGRSQGAIWPRPR